VTGPRVMLVGGRPAYRGHMASPRHVVIIGEMGVGKTTVGSAVAKLLARPFHDSDARLEADTGRSGAQIAAEDGVDALHDMELSVLLELLADETPAVIAPAASVVDVEEGRDALDSHHVVWLVASADAVASRRREGDHRRPLRPGERERLWEQRSQRFLDLADITVDTGDRTAAECASEVCERLGSPL
jgi:shikimate kinase